MSNKCVTWAWKQPLTSSIKLVLVNICDRANDQKGYQCWPAIETISKDTGLARRTVQRSLATLEKEKLIFESVVVCLYSLKMLNPNQIVTLFRNSNTVFLGHIFYMYSEIKIRAGRDRKAKMKVEQN